MSTQTLDCLTVVRQLWDYLDHELPPERWEGIRHHLGTCTGCREHVEFCRSFLLRVTQIPLDAGEVEALQARVLASLRREVGR